jgi:hypothetical protein
MQLIHYAMLNHPMHRCFDPAYAPHARFEINLVVPSGNLPREGFGRNYDKWREWYEKELSKKAHNFYYESWHRWVAAQEVEARHCFINENSGNLIIHTIAQVKKELVC